MKTKEIGSRGEVPRILLKCCLVFMESCVLFIIVILLITAAADPWFLFTARKRSLGQGNVCTSVCHSVHGGVDLHPGRVCIQAGSVSRRVCIWRGSASRVSLHPRGLHPVGFASRGNWADIGYYGIPSTVRTLLECILVLVSFLFDKSQWQLGK